MGFKLFLRGAHEQVLRPRMKSSSKTGAGGQVESPLGTLVHGDSLKRSVQGLQKKDQAVGKHKQVSWVNFIDI